MECLYVIMLRNSNIDWPRPRSSLAFQIGCPYESFWAWKFMWSWDCGTKKSNQFPTAAKRLPFLFSCFGWEPGQVWSLCEVALVPTMVPFNFKLLPDLLWNVCHWVLPSAFFKTLTPNFGWAWQWFQGKSFQIEVDLFLELIKIGTNIISSPVAVS